MCAACARKRAFRRHTHARTHTRLAARHRSAAVAVEHRPRGFVPLAVRRAIHSIRCVSASLQQAQQPSSHRSSSEHFSGHFRPPFSNTLSTGKCERLFYVTSATSWATFFRRRTGNPVAARPPDGGRKVGEFARRVRGVLYCAVFLVAVEVWFYVSIAVC